MGQQHQVFNICNIVFHLHVKLFANKILEVSVFIGVQFFLDPLLGLLACLSLDCRFDNLVFDMMDNLMKYGIGNPREGNDLEHERYGADELESVRPDFPCLVLDALTLFGIIVAAAHRIARLLGPHEEGEGALLHLLHVLLAVDLHALDQRLLQVDHDRSLEMPSLHCDGPCKSFKIVSVEHSLREADVLLPLQELGLLGLALGKEGRLLSLEVLAVVHALVCQPDLVARFRTRRKILRLEHVYFVREF